MFNHRQSYVELVPVVIINKIWFSFSVCYQRTPTGDTLNLDYKNIMQTVLFQVIDVWYVLKTVYKTYGP